MTRKGYLKFKTKFSKEDIQLLQKTAMIHSNSETEFGWFCAGVAIGLRTMFEDWVIVEGGRRYASMEVNKQASAAVTNILLKSFDETKVELMTAEVDKKDNRELSDKIMELAKDQNESAGR